MKIEDFELHSSAHEISKECWLVYESLTWQDKKIIGDQFITAIDSIGANIAESFGRFHFLDKNKFLYNARGSLFESLYWLDLLLERKKVQLETYSEIKKKLSKLAVKMNNFIAITKNQKLK